MGTPTRTTHRTPAPRALAAALGALVFVPAAAGAAHAAGAPPGDNGDVRIHRLGTPQSDPRTDPEVCRFYVAGQDFGPGQEIDWRVDTRPGGPRVASGRLVADANGTAATETRALPDGTYTLTWDVDGAAAPPARHKVFQVDCPDPTPTGPPPFTTGGGTGGTLPDTGGGDTPVLPLSIAAAGFFAVGAVVVTSRRLRRAG